MRHQEALWSLQCKCHLVYAVDHYSLVRYVLSFDFPLERDRSQFSVFLSGNGGSVSQCHVDLKPTGVCVVHEIGVDKSKQGGFMNFSHYYFIPEFQM